MLGFFSDFATAYNHVRIVDGFIRSLYRTICVYINHFDVGKTQLPRDIVPNQNLGLSQSGQQTNLCNRPTSKSKQRSAGANDTCPNV